MYRMCISVGDRDRGPGREVLRTHLLWVRKAYDCGPSLENDIIPDTGMYVPGTRYIFRHRGIQYQEYVYVVCARHCIGGLHVPYVDQY